MKKRGFDTQEIVEKLHEKGIEMKPQTLTKYLLSGDSGEQVYFSTRPEPLNPNLFPDIFRQTQKIFRR